MFIPRHLWNLTPSQMEGKCLAILRNIPAFRQASACSKILAMATRFSKRCAITSSSTRLGGHVRVKADRGRHCCINAVSRPFFGVLAPEQTARGAQSVSVAASTALTARWACYPIFSCLLSPCLRARVCRISGRFVFRADACVYT